MKLLCDEGVDLEVVEGLRGESHAVTYIAEVASGATDEEVFELARQSGSLLVTTDKDFGELVFRQRRIPSGVVLLRLAGLSQERKAESVLAVFRDHLDELTGGFVVIEPGKVRIRNIG